MPKNNAPKTAASKVTAPLKGKNSGKNEQASSIKEAIASFFGGRNKRRSALLIGGKQDAWRYQVIWLVMLFFLAALVLFVLRAQLFGNEAAKQLNEKQVLTTRTLKAYRGLIVDRNGTPLAANAPLVTVSLDPKAYAEMYHELNKDLQTAKTAEETAKISAKLDEIDLVKIAAAANFDLEQLKEATNLAQKIDYNAKDVDDQIKKALPSGKGSSYLVLLKRVPPEAADALMQLNKGNILAKEVQYKRYYLQAEPNAHILGYLGNAEDGKTQVGRAGLEARFNGFLSGQDGLMRILKDRKNQPIREVEEIKPLVEGKDLHLTIDSRLQYVLYKELEQVGRLQSARSSSGIVVDVKTGDVLAMGSWPSFNSNNLAERDGANERNRPVLDVFEPGSVMKPFTVVAALESGKYNTNSLIDTTPGSLFVGGYTIKDGANYGVITLSKLIQKSSNVASAKIALSLPADGISQMQRKFGFGQKTHLNFPAEAAGMVNAPKTNELSRRATLSYGYGQQVTLAQLAQAYATLGNQGVMQPLNIVEDVEKGAPVQVISASNAQAIVQMMELVTGEGGTGRLAAINGYRVAGKTGTTRRNKPEGGYYTDQHRAVFVGVAPASNPRFAVAILVEDPRRQSYAGQVAAPVFRDVMKEALRLYNVPYDKPLYSETANAK